MRAPKNIRRDGLRPIDTDEPDADAGKPQHASLGPRKITSRTEAGTAGQMPLLTKVVSATYRGQSSLLSGMIPAVRTQPNPLLLRNGFL